MNRQPFYYEVTVRVLFTGTREFSEREIANRLQVKMKGREAILSGSVEVHIDEVEGEPGDPADLL